MGRYAIKVSGLGKLYTIGAYQGRYKSLRDSLTRSIAAPLRRLLHPETAAAKAERQIWALKDVSFEIQHGEVVGIIGRNGAGKSTLLKLLSRITEPSEGEIRMKGRVGSLLEVGTGFHPELTGRENIFLNGAILGMSRDEIRRKFDEIVDFAEIEKFIDTPAKHYSSGMYMRLAFAVAAHLEPEILLVDEVLAVGDAQFQKKCLGKMGEVAKEGRTVLFVSHNMAAVQYLCQNGIFLEDGNIAYLGAITNAIDAYISQSIVKSLEILPGEFLVTDRKNSYLENTIIIQKVSLMSADSSRANIFRMGSELNIRVDVHGMSEYPNAAMGIIFKNSADQILAGINTLMNCTYTEKQRNRDEYGLLKIPRLYFTPGNYSIAVSITSDNKRIDYIDHAAHFSIIEADVYNTGYNVDSQYGLLFIDGFWEIRRS